jgi:hypothetical protein
MNNEHDTGMKAIDLYETPIDLRPVPKLDIAEECIAYLLAHGDHYGVQLLRELQREKNPVTTP